MKETVEFSVNRKHSAGSAVTVAILAGLLASFSLDAVGQSTPPGMGPPTGSAPPGMGPPGMGPPGGSGPMTCPPGTPPEKCVPPGSTPPGSTLTPGKGPGG